MHSLELTVDLVETLFEPLASVVCCVKDLEGRYLAVNSAFVGRTGHESKSDVLGKTAAEVFPTTLAKGYEAQDRQVLQLGKALVDQLERIRNTDGTTGWYLTNKYPVRDATGRVVGLVGVSQDLDEPAERSLRISRLAEVADYIRRHLDEPLRIEDLAVGMGLSVKQFERRMHKVFRLTPKQFVTKCRIDEATRLLIETNQPLPEIAGACGFSDQSSFTRQFKSTTGYAPGEFRRHHGSRLESAPGRVPPSTIRAGERSR
jgi:PAS domain S-box-containing protein